ncbi:MAG: beta-lactamase family protein [Actinomycetota bacterium]|nr:MAG: beta-lactamase family protein [Actinomycetota bacterium]
MEEALAQLGSWPVPTAAAAIVGPDGVFAQCGPPDHRFRLASISKVCTAWAVLVAVEEGSVHLDEPAGPAGSTLRHLLSHAGGYPFDGERPLLAPERKRIYSNTGIEVAARHVAVATGIDFADYLREAVFEPLAMTSTALAGSPAHAVWSTLTDTARFAAELLRPRLLAPATAAQATTIQFATLDGTVPGLGTFRPCPWGLGPEIRGAKQPHWTGLANSPATFGHFGGAGTMLWVDPVADIALVALTDRPFDEWAPEALQHWSALSDSVLAAAPAREVQEAPA